MARKSKQEDKSGDRGVEFAIANWDMQRTQSYVERGRQFENATAEDLQALFVQAFRDWRANLWRDGRRTRVADVSAEYTLRGVDPPYALVEEALLEIGSKSRGGRRASRRAEIAALRSRRIGKGPLALS